MTTLRLKYVHRFTDRHGRVRHYARIPGRKQVPLKGDPGSEQFMADYAAALDGAPKVATGASKLKPGSVAEAVAAYYEHVSFVALAEGTRKMRRAILERFRAEYGERPLAPLRKVNIEKLLGKKKPFAARNWLKTLRHFMAFAVKTERIAADPTAHVEKPKAKAGERHTWTEAEIAQFEERHPIGTRARLALALFLYTALRRGDAVRVGRQHVHDGELSIRQQKTGSPVEIDVHPELAAIIDATPREHLTFLTTAKGKPFSAAGFGNLFRRWCNEAGLPKQCSAHGLRKATARRLADLSRSTHELKAVGGWQTLSEVERYTKDADRKRLAKTAMAALVKAYPARTK